MFKIEFMILYLAEIIIAALVILVSYLAGLFAVTVFDLILRFFSIIKKGGKKDGQGE